MILIATLFGALGILCFLTGIRLHGMQMRGDKSLATDKKWSFIFGLVCFIIVGFSIL